MTGQRKERPILFNAEMVNAILSGRKTQTRRIVKCNFQDIGFNHDMGQEWPWSEDCEHAEDYWHPCPLGKPGDQLWVRETFGQYRAAPSGFVYRADGELSCGDPERWTPSIHMPRRASRINLLITGVRVERLNDISEQDAKAEGAQQYDINRFTTDEINLLDTPLNNLDTPYTNGFALLWESCYGSGSWAVNPFVWVIDFEKTN
ncbi:hypothetical protein [Yersinia mollaretii]|uniref:hypothetical protein n=1 Tax=Yersinia mollaretii TaxID=33060 RepID=UPI0011A47ED3|nr:hypothetical protein [Yersinia mollaretii]